MDYLYTPSLAILVSAVLVLSCLYGHTESQTNADDRYAVLTLYYRRRE